MQPNLASPDCLTPYWQRGLGDLVVSGDDGRVGFGGPGDGVLEVVVEALMGLVGALLDNAVDDLGRGAADGADRS